MPTTKNSAPKPTPFGVRIKELRLARGWSQDHLSRVAGIATGMVTHIETGRRGKKPGRELIVKLSQALGANVDELMGLAGLEEPSKNSVVKARPQFRAFINTDPLLTETQKQTLINMYEDMIRGR